MTVPDFDLEVTGQPMSKAVEKAFRYIASLIDLKQVRQGERLPSSAALSAEIGVNRPAVLQALKQLEKQGQVVVGTGRAGARVFEPIGAALDARVAWVFENAETIKQMAILREMIEPGIARLLATNGMASDQLLEAKRLLNSMEQPIDQQDYLALDTQFHSILAQATGMEVLSRLGLLIRRWVAPAIDIIPWPPNRRMFSTQEHAELINAIEVADPDRAALVALKHVEAGTTLILSTLSSGNPRTSRTEEVRGDQEEVVISTPVGWQQPSAS